MNFKKLLCIILSVLLILSLCSVAAYAADDDDEDPDDYDSVIYVNGKQLTDENTTVKCGSGNAVYDPDEGTVTLTNAEITKSYEYQKNYKALIYSSDAAIDIILVGNNKLIGQSADDDGIDAAGGCDINITGSGSLDISNVCYGFYIGSWDEDGGCLTVENATVTVAAKGASGIWANNDIFIYNSKVTVSTEKQTYSGIVSNIDGTIYVDESELTITAPGNGILLGNGDSSAHAFELYSGNVEINAGTGIYCEPVSATGAINATISVSGGKLTVNAADRGTNITEIMLDDGIDYIEGTSLLNAGKTVIGVKGEEPSESETSESESAASESSSSESGSSEQSSSESAPTDPSESESAASESSSSESGSSEQGSSESAPTDPSESESTASESSSSESGSSEQGSSESAPTDPSESESAASESSSSESASSEQGVSESSATEPGSSETDSSSSEKPAPKTIIIIKAVKTEIKIGASTLVRAIVKNGSGKTKYISSNKKVAAVSESGKVKGLKAGSVIISAKNNGAVAKLKLKVVKKNNPMTVKAKKITAKSKKTVKFSKAKAFTIKKSKGTLSFTRKAGNKKISINKKTGAITVKKGLKKGKTYKFKVKVKAKGNATYKPKTKVVNVIIIIR